MSKRYKYPRTPHLRFSEGATNDDKILKSHDHFHNRRVIVSEKMDGEATSIYKDGSHARSLDSAHHSSRDHIKVLQAKLSTDIPDGWRICGENLYAEHSISYTNLSSYFLVFSIWNEHNFALSWDDTLFWCDLFGLDTVPVLYDGIWDEKLISTLYDKKDYDHKEGYVVRAADEFSYDNFGLNIAKFVRKNHVTSSSHWSVAWKRNKLITDETE